MDIFRLRDDKLRDRFDFTRKLKIEINKKKNTHSDEFNAIDTIIIKCLVELKIFF